MSVLNTEVRQVQNPAFGALLIWRCVFGYAEASKDGEGCPLPVVFLVLPLLLHEATQEYVRRTVVATGLRGLVGKFGTARNDESDLILQLNERAQEFRALTLRSVQVGIRARLITIDATKATLHVLTKTMPRAGVSEKARTAATQASKLGTWFAQVTLAETSSLLRVRF